MYIYRTVKEFFLEWKIFQTKVVEKIKTCIYISCSIIFFRKLCRLWENVKKYGIARQVTDDNNSTVHAHCMLDNKEHRHSLRISLLLFNGNKRYANTKHCYVYTHTACLVHIEYWFTFHAFQFLIPFVCTLPTHSYKGTKTFFNQSLDENHRYQCFIITRIWKIRALSFYSYRLWSKHIRKPIAVP